VTITTPTPQAGEAVSWLVRHKDLYDNETWHRLEAFQLSFKVAGVDQPCLQELSVDCCSTQVTSYPTQAGEGLLVVKYCGSLLCEIAVVVRPGPVSPEHCKATGEGLRPTYISKAGQITRTFEYELRDKFNNLTNAEVKFAVTDHEGLSCSPQVHSSQCQYQVSRPGAYTIDLLADGQRLPGFPFCLSIARDPAEVEAEQREAHLRMLLEARRRADEEAALRAKLELEAKEAAERKRLEEARRRAEQEAAKVTARQKAEEDLELEKRRRIVERIKRQEETERRAAEALEKLRKMKAEEKPKARRIGGGFVLIDP
jgi:hypothetical protein